MLTAKKRAFIENYKLHRNYTEAAKLSGYSARTAGSQGSRLLKDVDISIAIKSWEDSEKARIEQLIPSKKSFLVQTFEKAKTVEHPPTSAKYWEIGGKAMGYLADEEKQEGDTVQIICRELHLSTSPKNSLNNHQTNLIISQIDSQRDTQNAAQSSDSITPHNTPPEAQSA